MVFKFAYLVDLTKGYQPEKLQCCKLSGSSFTEELQKYSDDIIMTSCHSFWDSKFSYFVHLLIGYQSAKYQVLQLSELNFTEVSIRHPKTSL